MDIKHGAIRKCCFDECDIESKSKKAKIADENIDMSHIDDIRNNTDINTDMDLNIPEMKECNVDISLGGDDCICPESIEINAVKWGASWCSLLLENRPHIKKLKFVNLNWDGKVNLPGLEELELENCTFEPSEPFQAYYLTKLKLSKCIVNYTFLFSLSRCDFLQHIELDHVLTTENIHKKRSLDTQMFNRIIEKNHEIKRFIFKMAETHSRNNTMPLIVDDSTIKSLHQACFRLEWIHIDGIGISRQINMMNLLQSRGDIRHYVLKNTFYL